MRCLANQSFASERTTAQTRHVRLGRRFVDEDEPGRVERALATFPSASGFGDVRPVLFCRVERLFLYVSPILVRTQWIAPIVQPSSNFCFISTSVTSGSFSTSLRMRSPCSGSSRALRPQYRYLGLRSPVRVLCARSFFTIPTDTLKRLATSSLVPSFPS